MGVVFQMYINLKVWFRIWIYPFIFMSFISICMSVWGKGLNNFVEANKHLYWFSGHRTRRENKDKCTSISTSTSVVQNCMQCNDSWNNRIKYENFKYISGDEVGSLFSIHSPLKSRGEWMIQLWKLFLFTLVIANLEVKYMSLTIHPSRTQTQMKGRCTSGIKSRHLDILFFFSCCTLFISRGRRENLHFHSFWFYFFVRRQLVWERTCFLSHPVLQKLIP